MVIIMILNVLKKINQKRKNQKQQASSVSPNNIFVKSSIARRQEKKEKDGLIYKANLDVLLKIAEELEE